LFAASQRICAERGLILVDTKYELGKTPDGEIVVIDEIHTPDSSRFWFEDSLAARARDGRMGSAGAIAQGNVRWQAAQ
jgi:phosphoribosylaminoimidazole-succinocarboxamide synthase